MSVVAGTKKSDRGRSFGGFCVAERGAVSRSQQGCCVKTWVKKLMNDAEGRKMRVVVKAIGSEFLFVGWAGGVVLV